MFPSMPHKLSEQWLAPLATCSESAHQTARPTGSPSPQPTPQRRPAPLAPSGRGPLGAAYLLAAVAAAVATLGALVLVLLLTAPVSATPGGIPDSSPRSDSSTTTITLAAPAKAQVEALTARVELIRAEIEALDTELEKQSEEFNRLTVALEDLNVQMASLRRELQSAEAEHAHRQRLFNERIRAVYKAGGRDQLLQLLLLSENAGDLYQRVRLVASLAEQDRRLIENLQQSKERLDALVAQMEQKKRLEVVLRDKLKQQSDAVDSLLARRQAILGALDAKVAEVIERERIRQEEEQKRLREAMAALLAAGQTYTGPLPEIDDAVLRQVVETAATYLGVPYLWGGSLPSTGMDCSGFTRWVYAQHGVRLHHYSRYQAEMGAPVAREEIQPGDLVAFGSPVYHVGIYIGEDLFIHAPRTGDVIKISRLSARGDLAAIRRFELKPRNGPPLVR